jgi:predicted type IV restriction endonuclease
MDILENWKLTIDDIRNNINLGNYINEAAVSGGIVRRLLELLNWPIYNPKTVSPEYSLQTKKADYALCFPEGKPKIIVEVKAIGNIQGGDEQLCDYAFKSGVPIAILTDGKEWHFYYPAGEGHISNRRFYKIDLFEREFDEIKNRFDRYLEYGTVKSGKALENAQIDYKNRINHETTKVNIPIAFNRLVEENDLTLIKLISEKVSDICGIEAGTQDIIDFLRQRVNIAKTDTTQQLPKTKILTTDVQQESILNNSPNSNQITEFNERCIIIKIQQKRVLQNNGDIYKTVRSCWRNSISKAEQADYVLAVIEGIVKEVYKPTEWYYPNDECISCDSENKPCGRIAFHGNLANNDVRNNYINKYIPNEYRKPGMASPVLFTY